MKFEQGKLVVLELGEGFSLPPILRDWNKELAYEDGVRFVRVSLNGSEIVPWELEDAVGIGEDAAWVVGEIFKGL
ncbi:hypothetical protein RUND412_011692, partial [Rhizina undulata]